MYVWEISNLFLQLCELKINRIFFIEKFVFLTFVDVSFIIPKYVINEILIEDFFLCFMDKTTVKKNKNSCRNNGRDDRSCCWWWSKVWHEISHKFYHFSILVHYLCIFIWIFCNRQLVWFSCGNTCGHVAVIYAVMMTTMRRRKNKI